MSHTASTLDSPKQPIRVLHVTFNMGIGGTEQVIRQLIEGMDSAQVQSEILCIDGHVGSMGEDLREAGVKVHTIARKPGFDRALVSGIREHLREGDFDIIHCHQYTPYFYGWLAARGTKARVVFTEHGRFHPDRYRYKAFFINPVIARFTPSIVAISRATKCALAQYEFMPENKIDVIYNGITGLVRNEAETQKLRATLEIPINAFIVGTVARLDQVKNQAMMLRAFKELLLTCPDAWLLIVGDGPENYSLRELAADLNIADRVTFTGFIRKPANYLAMMSLFLLTSHTEGTSMTLLEAMSLGIPAVVTEVGGNPEIVVHEHTGILVPPGNTADFSSAVSRLVNDNELREALSLNSKERFQKEFSNHQMIKSYQKIYYS